MIEYLEGRVEYKRADYVALDISGVGYKIFISLKSYEQIRSGEKYRFYISEIIKEDSHKLIGFLEEKERKLFEMLLSVKGIGASLGIAILSTFSYDKIIEFIRNEDFKNLKRVPKLGEKKAKLLILDLKTKMKKASLDITCDLDEVKYDMEDDLTLALKGLGYGSKDIQDILQKINLSDFESIEQAIKHVLKIIANK